MYVCIYVYRYICIETPLSLSVLPLSVLRARVRLRTSGHSMLDPSLGHVDAEPAPGLPLARL